MEITKFNLSLASKPVADIDLYGSKVYLYRLFTSDLETFIASQNEVDCYERIKKLLSSIAGFGNSGNKNLKEDRVQLDSRFLEKISNSDLDIIADIYISTPVMQETFKQFSKNKELLEKDAGESPTKHLERLLDKYIKDYTENGSYLKNAFLNASSMDKIFDSTRKSSDLLGATLESYKKLNSIAFVNSSLPDSFYADTKLINEQNNQYHKIANDRKTELEKFNLIADMSAQSANLLKELSDAATKFLEQSETRAIQNEITTDSQIKYAIWSLIGSVVLSGFSLCFAYQSYLQDKQNNASNEKWQNDLIDLQKNSLAKNTLSVQELVSAKSEISTLKTELGNLKKDLVKIQIKQK